ncbi:MAG TPA: host attachment protein [Burkholderiales bacterium]|nr:host attachment protein [Burkholderiales bacterium]
MQTTWIVAADASRARIFRMLGRNQIEEIEDFIHKESRQKDRELRTDAVGQFSVRGAMPGGDMVERTDPTDHEAEIFSRTIGSYLEKARTQNKYDQLCLIAPPKFLGLLRKNLSKEAQRMVDKEVPKDISWFNPRDLESYIRSTRELPD